MNKIKKVFYVLVLSIIIIAANICSYVGGQNSIVGKEYSLLKNNCVPIAIGMQKQLKERGVESKILVFAVELSSGAVCAHAMVLFKFNSGTYLYDKNGTNVLSPTTNINDPISVTEQITDATIISAKFLDN